MSTNQTSATGGNANLDPLRKDMQLHLLQNPNYFGTLKDAEIVKKFPPILILGENQVFYEQLNCIDYNPETRVLGATIQIKQETGYNGTWCTGGSKEYVRFYLDYTNSGTWVDVGLGQVAVHDHDFTDNLCYYAQVVIQPEKLSCCFQPAILPKVRAILSWNIVPPPNTPNYPVVWGNMKEAHIQMAPSTSVMCDIAVGVKELQNVDLSEKVLHPSFLESYVPHLNATQVKPAIKPPAVLAELVKSYDNINHQSRLVTHSVDIVKLAHHDQNAYLQAQKLFVNYNLQDIIKNITGQKYNTTYETITCVSLNSDLNELHATVTTKLKLGYIGGLCTAGSKEYVAFYLDFGSGYQYMGTSSVDVHDIPTNPTDGLNYDVSLNVNLDKHRKQWCAMGKAKILGILSWNTPPTPNDPNYTAVWGDRRECNIEIKPLPQGVQPGTMVPFMEKVGGMVVTDINNVTGLATSSTGSTSLAGAYESPFYNAITIIGRIFNASPGTKYRFKISTPGSAVVPLLVNQVVQTDTLGVISAPITLVPDAQGWMDYLATNPNIAIVGDQIGLFYTGAEGMYSIGIELKDPSNTIITGNTVHIWCDNQSPNVSINITTGGGDCADFTIGETISGYYTMTDEHASSFSIFVTPDKGALVGVDGAVPVATSAGLSYPGGGLPATGKSGSFTINTAGVPKCGYNVWIYASDRTIVNSSYVGLTSNTVQGFCLRQN